MERSLVMGVRRCRECAVSLPADFEGEQCAECPLIHCPECGGWRGRDAVECAGCLSLAERASDVPWDERCKGCGKRAREGKSRCAVCQEVHVHLSAVRRQRSLRRVLHPELRQKLLKALREGGSMPEVARELGTSQQRVWAAAQRWEWWREELDAALMDGRPGGVEHGTVWAYKRGRCRCPECREAKREDR